MVKVTKEDKIKYADKKPIGVLPLSNWGGIEVLDIEHGIEDYAIVRWYGDSIHRVKIHYGEKENTFKLYNRRYSFSDIMKV